MPYLPFGDLAPDQPSNNADVLRRADNVVYLAGQYRPLPGRTPATQFSITIGADYELVRARSFQLDFDDSTLVLIVQNDANAQVWVAHRGITRQLTGNALVPSVYWNLVQFGSNAIIASRSNALQKVDLSTDSITEYEQIHVQHGEHVAVVRTRLIHAGASDAASTVYFSAINDFSFDAASTTNPGGSQELPDTGIITAVTGGETGHVFTERGVFRLTETNDDLIYQIDNISTEVGCGVRGWATRVGADQYFYSNSGFKKLMGDQIVDIGHGRVDLRLAESVRDSSAVQSAVVHWEDAKVLFFALCGEFVFAYNYAEDRFSFVDAGALCVQGWTLFEFGGAAISDQQFVGHRISDSQYENVRINDLRFGRSGESQVEVVLEGGAVVARAIGYDGEGFEPARAVGLIETNEVYAFNWLEGEQDERSHQRRGAIAPSSRMFSSEGRLVGDLSSEYNLVASVAVAARDNEYAPPYNFDSFTPVFIDRDNTLLAWMVEGRYMSFQVKLDGYFGYVSGIDVAIEDAGLQEGE